MVGLALAVKVLLGSTVAEGASVGVVAGVSVGTGVAEAGCVLVRMGKAVPVGTTGVTALQAPLIIASSTLASAMLILLTISKQAQ
jgi:hypothetical protein